MKILQVNNVYAEQSTGKITKVLHDGLREAGYESVVVYGRGRTVREAGVIRLCSNMYGKFNGLLARVTGMPYGGCILSTWRLQRIMRRENPDVVHLQCINGHFVNIYRLITWLKKRRIRTVVALHAEFMYTANCGHAFACDRWKRGCVSCPDFREATKSWFFDQTGRSWRRMKAAFDGFEQDCVIAPVSAWTEKRARQSDILKTFPFQTVFNGVNTEVFCRKNNEPEEPGTVLNVTAHFSPDPGHEKGGCYLMELARRMPDVKFLVAGRAERCGDIPDNMKLIGLVQDQNELAGLYRRASVSVLVSKRETFSMPCVESLCCGTPVVGFKAGGPEEIALPEFSVFVEHGDIDGLEETLRIALNGGYDREAIADAGKKNYSGETLVRRFMELYGRLG